MNYLYRKFKLANAFFIKLYVLFFFRNKKNPSHDHNVFVVDYEKPTSSASSVIVTDTAVENFNPTIDEDILKTAEELEALKIDKKVRTFTLEEANVELVKAGSNLSKLTRQEEIFFQALEKALNCPVLVNAKPAYLFTYPIALLYEAHQSGLLADSIFFSQLALRYDDIPSSYFFKSEKEAIFSLQKPDQQRTHTHYIEIAKFIYKKISGEFFYDSSRFLSRCRGINIETGSQMDAQLQQRLDALREGRPSENGVELALRAKFFELQQQFALPEEDLQGGNELQDQLVSLPEVPITVPSNAPVVVQSKSAKIHETVTTVEESKLEYHGISEMTAAFLRGFIPKQKTRNDLLKPLTPDREGNTCSLQTIVENSSFANRDFYQSEVKEKSTCSVPGLTIEKVSEVVNKAQFEDRKLFREEADIEKREACAAKMIKEIESIISASEKKKQGVKEDYQLLKDNCPQQEQLKIYFDSILLDIDSIIQGYGRDDISVYEKIKQELLDLRSAVTASQTTELTLKIHSRPYWHEKESLQAMQGFLSVEHLRLNSAFYKKTTPKFRQEIDRNKYNAYCEIYTRTMRELYNKGCFPSLAIVPTIYTRTESANLSQKTPTTHFFQPKKVFSSVAKVALFPFLILS